MASLAPLRPVAPFLALAAGSLALDGVPQIPWSAGVAGAGLFAAAAVVRRAQVAAELRSQRRVADDRILRGRGVPVWREHELTSSRARAVRRREVERLLRSASVERLPSASPIDRGAVRKAEPLFRRLAERLADDRPISPRGILFVDQLLRDPASPLYATHPELLPRAISRVIGALDE
jgi:hypothetical protein